MVSIHMMMYVVYIVPNVLNVLEVSLKKGMMRGFQLNVLLRECFAWLSYLVHFCTNTILLHLFTPSVGDGD